MSHIGDISKEDPLIINPAEMEPNNHIYFVKEVIRAKTKKGKITIKHLDLNRQSLIEDRKKTLESLTLLKRGITRLSGQKKIKAGLNLSLRLSEAKGGKGAFSKMIVDNFNL